MLGESALGCPLDQAIADVESNTSSVSLLSYFVRAVQVNDLNSHTLPFIHRDQIFNRLANYLAKRGLKGRLFSLPVAHGAHSAASCVMERATKLGRVCCRRRGDAPLLAPRGVTGTSTRVHEAAR
jgi:hypothetical protein